MDKKAYFDFWYAVNNTEIVLMPSRQLETFGTTILNYYMAAELMDNPHQIRIREGRIHANRPKIITPQAYAEVLLEGFGEEARKYIEWLREHEKDVHILQYGYMLRRESFSEYTVSGNILEVVEQIKKSVQEKNDPLAAVLIGVDKPWDVCLIKLFWEVAVNSVEKNVMDMRNAGLFDELSPSPRGLKEEIERDFLTASRNPALINALYRKLKKYNLFEHYQDRFFNLVRMAEARKKEGK